MEKYIINENTMLIKYNGKFSKIIEKNKTINILSTPLNIVDESCKYYGSSLKGRSESTCYLIGTAYKNPIIISEVKKIIFFPTYSYIKEDSVWINLKSIKKYKSCNDLLEIILTNNKKIIINISIKSFTNQLFKATRLETIYKNQKC